MSSGPQFDPSVFGIGLATGLGLIVAIGAQNAFVIRQGVLRQHVFAVAALCTAADAALISLGVAGLGALIAQAPLLVTAARWGGAAYLVWFGARAAWNAVRRDHKGLDAAEAETVATGSLRRVLLATAGFTFLNPHVYLDTVVMLGGIGAQYADWPDRLAFLTGATSGSLIWFAGLALGARAISPVFHRPMATRLLDGFVAAVMWFVAALLVTGGLG